MQFALSVSTSAAEDPEDEHKDHLVGEVIKEEDEDMVNFDDDFKEALRIK